MVPYILLVASRELVKRRAPRKEEDDMSTKTITLGNKTFNLGDTIIVESFWVSSDGPMPGYVANVEGRIVGIGKKLISFTDAHGNMGRMNREKFTRFNA